LLRSSLSIGGGHRLRCRVVLRVCVRTRQSTRVGSMLSEGTRREGGSKINRQPQDCNQRHHQDGRQGHDAAFLLLHTFPQYRSIMVVWPFKVTVGCLLSPGSVGMKKNL
jgi:hypothetical protein